MRETPILSLQIVEAISEAPVMSPRKRIESLLADTPLSQRQIRDAAKMRASTVSSVLKEMVFEGCAVPDGYCLAPSGHPCGAVRRREVNAACTLPVPDNL